jgi:hypothetical protein
VTICKAAPTRRRTPISLALPTPESSHTKASHYLRRSDWRTQSGSTKPQPQSVGAHAVTNCFRGRLPYFY